MASIKMPFGKYRGKRLISVPSEYLTWLLANNEDLDADLRKAVEHELDRRGDAPQKKETEPTEEPGGAAHTVSPLGQRLAGDVRMLFRNLALKYHPDRGGSPDAMQALNELHDQVQELLSRTFTGP
jgi:hypothetical protein